MGLEYFIVERALRHEKVWNCQEEGFLWGDERFWGVGQQAGKKGWKLGHRWSQMPKCGQQEVKDFGGEQWHDHIYPLEFLCTRHFYSWRSEWERVRIYETLLLLPTIPSWRHRYYPFLSCSSISPLHHLPATMQSTDAQHLKVNSLGSSTALFPGRWSQSTGVLRWKALKPWTYRCLGGNDCCPQKGEGDQIGKPISQ